MKAIITGAITLAILMSPATVVAETLTQADVSALFNLNTTEFKEPIILQVKEKPVVPVKPDPVVYTVVSGDNLTKIGTAHNVKWQRLWAKNTQLSNPDILHVGDKITIPMPDEKLDRPLPVAVSLPVDTPDVVVASASFDSSNTYDSGYCTWYVKNRRGASLPNGLGNANTWYARARALGMAVGSTPKAGAVGTTTGGYYGHVVYVEAVNGDGTVTISEMNYEGFGIRSSRVASASDFLYIY